jgi:hypothetical protein
MPLPAKQTNLESAADAVYRVEAASTGVNDLVAAIRAVFNNNVDANWEVESYNTDTGAGLLLRCKNQNSNDEQSQIFIAANASPAKLNIAYAPHGGITSITSTDIGGSAPSGYSGLKQITGPIAAATAMSSYGTTIWIASYSDAITIFIGGTNESFFRYGAHVGKVFAPDNESDESIYIDGSAVIVGFPTNTSVGASISTGHWLGYSTTNGLGSSIRIGQNSWSNLTAGAIVAAEKADADGRLRLAPYYVGGSISASPMGGILGRTKYLREYKVTLPHLVLLPSNANDSNQAWIGWEFTAGTPQAQIILWKKGSSTLTTV